MSLPWVIHMTIPSPEAKWTSLVKSKADERARKGVTVVGARIILAWDDVHGEDAPDWVAIAIEVDGASPRRRNAIKIPLPDGLTDQAAEEIADLAMQRLNAWAGPFLPPGAPL